MFVDLPIDNLKCPDLAGRTGLVVGVRFAPDWELGSAKVMLLTIRAQDTAEAGLGCQTPPLISQFWHDLAWWQAAKFLWITGFQHRRAFGSAQLVGGFRARRKNQ